MIEAGARRQEAMPAIFVVYDCTGGKPVPNGPLGRFESVPNALPNAIGTAARGADLAGTKCRSCGVIRRTVCLEGGG